RCACTTRPVDADVAEDNRAIVAEERARSGGGCPQPLGQPRARSAEHARKRLRLSTAPHRPYRQDGFLLASGSRIRAWALVAHDAQERVVEEAERDDHAASWWSSARRRARTSRAASSLRSRAAQISVPRPARKSAGVM